MRLLLLTDLPLPEWPFSLSFLFVVLLAAGCGGADENGSTISSDSLVDTTAAMSTTRMAWAQLEPASGSGVSGEVQFTETPEGVEIVASVQELPEGDHGIHIHETGDCSAPDASSAGGHFAPEGNPHGAPDAPREERHLGDLGNITASASGETTYTRTDPHLTLTGQHSIIGQAVVIHAEADDLTSQPSGNAGARIACGEITWDDTSG